MNGYKSKPRQFGVLSLPQLQAKVKPTKRSETPNHYSKLGISHLIFRDIALDLAC